MRRVEDLIAYRLPSTWKKLRRAGCRCHGGGFGPSMFVRQSPLRRGARLEKGPLGRDPANFCVNVNALRTEERWSPRRDTNYRKVIRSRRQWKVLLTVRGLHHARSQKNGGHFWNNTPFPPNPSPKRGAFWRHIDFLDRKSSGSTLPFSFRSFLLPKAVLYRNWHVMNKKVLPCNSSITFPPGEMLYTVDQNYYFNLWKAKLLS